MSEADIDPTAFLPPGVELAVEPEEADETSNQDGSDHLPASPEPAPSPREPVDVAALTRIESEFAAVEAALAAIDDGTYGTCSVCGDAIDPALLAAEPVRRGCSSHPVVTTA
jgi:RNA polymerase-binding transcription factor DksA